jgi:hypothetical protein
MQQQPQQQQHQQPQPQQPQQQHNMMQQQPGHNSNMNQQWGKYAQLKAMIILVQHIALLSDMLKEALVMCTHTTAAAQQTTVHTCLQCIALFEACCC